MAIKVLSNMEVITPTSASYAANKGYADDNFLSTSKINGVNIKLENNSPVSLRFPEYVKTTESPHISYVVGDIVRFNNTLWRCIQATDSSATFNTDNWSLLIGRRSGYISDTFTLTASTDERNNVQDGICSFNYRDFTVGGGGGVSLRFSTWESSHDDEKGDLGREGSYHPTSFSYEEKIVYNGALYRLKKEDGLLVNRGSYVASNTYMTDDVVWFRGRYVKCKVDNVRNKSPVSTAVPWRATNTDYWQDISPGFDGGEYWQLLSTPIKSSKSISLDPVTHQLEVDSTFQSLEVTDTSNRDVNLLWRNKHWICSIGNTATSRNFVLPTPASIEKTDMYTAELIMRCEAKSPADEGITIAFKHNNTAITFLGDVPAKFERGYNYFIVFRYFPANVIPSGVSETPDTIIGQWVGNIQGKVPIPVPAS